MTAGLAPSPVLPERTPVLPERLVRRGIGGAIPPRRAGVARPWITTVPAPASPSVAPAEESSASTVAVALRSKASAVADAELGRLASRAPGLDASARDEVRDAVQRVVDAFLEGPLPRLTRHSGSPSGERYADALRTLFGLDPGRTT
ncbi:hypothetical protein MTP10_19260 [Nonomuraea sp. 3-1Str]|uniref:hypothetical protein n=1 Tax=Nonomuraea sp. 3-1Str TaxID=2929801 RepID=UPI00285A3973|nr:hypothetical protein [Nonomuraea sp. 3-1Str]MDR8410862.1 hypothetical protein [Nonomuraea sp. 3-1Str]